MVVAPMSTATSHPVGGAFIRAEVLPYADRDDQIVEWATWQQDIIRIVLSSTPAMAGLRRLCDLIEDEAASGLTDEQLDRLAKAAGLADADDEYARHKITGLDVAITYELHRVVPAVVDAVRATPVPASQTAAIEGAATIADEILATLEEDR